VATVGGLVSGLVLQNIVWGVVGAAIGGLLTLAFTNHRRLADAQFNLDQTLMSMKDCENRVSEGMSRTRDEIFQTLELAARQAKDTAMAAALREARQQPPSVKVSVGDSTSIGSISDSEAVAVGRNSSANKSD